MTAVSDTDSDIALDEHVPSPKLLIYTESFAPLSETFVYRLAIGIEKMAVKVLTHQRINESAFPDKHLNIDVVDGPRSSILWRAWTLFGNSLRHGLPWSEKISLSPSVYRPDVIFAHFATCGFRALPGALKNQVPLVTMFHGCDLGSWLGFPRYRASLSKLFEKGDAFIVATEFMRARAEGLGCPAGKIHKIGYPIPRLRNIETSQRHPKKADPIRFLHVGRLHSQKGVLYSIKAFARVAKVRPQTELVIVGDGPERLEAEALVSELLISEKVHFRGALTFSRVEAELAGADVYVIHSVTTAAGDTEGFGVSLAEASEAGLPIIATWHNGFPEVVLDGQSGILVPEKDIEAMASAMVRLADDARLRQKMGAAGRQHVRAMFAPEYINAQYERLFLSLLQQRSKYSESYL